MSRRLESECVLWHECLAMVQSTRTCACGNHDGHMRRGLSRGSPGANPRGRCRGDCIRRQGPCLTGAEGRDDSGAHIWDNAGAHSVLFVKMAGGHACACALEYEWVRSPSQGRSRVHSCYLRFTPGVCSRCLQYMHGVRVGVGS